MLRRVLHSIAGRLGYVIAPEDHAIVLWRLDEAGTANLLRNMRPVATRFPLIRLGGDADGAYLIPDDLEGVAALFSPGVAEVAEFERQIAARGIDCFLADASVEASPVQNSRVRFSKKFLGPVDDQEYMRLDSWVNECCPGTSDLMLQMDIEGAEWGVLLSTSPELLNRFRIIVIEFHDTIRLLDCDLRRTALERLLSTHHVVHAHVNNAGAVARKRGLDFPQFLEMTFLRKDRADSLGAATPIPHPLDVVNAPWEPERPTPNWLK